MPDNNNATTNTKSTPQNNTNQNAQRPPLPTRNLVQTSVEIFSLDPSIEKGKNKK
jgi:hypothetical protein|nr:MAG TPA: hypothetical protein [Caudoviricetes sp.]